MKGGGGAHAREKIVAAAADRFVVIVSSDKLVDRRPPIPLELVSFGLAATLERLGEARLRDAPSTPDGGVLADWVGPVDDPLRSLTDWPRSLGSSSMGSSPRCSSPKCWSDARKRSSGSRRAWWGRATRRSARRGGRRSQGPRSLGVALDRRRGVEQRLHDAPRLLDDVPAREERAVSAQGVREQAFVRLRRLAELVLELEIERDRL